MMVTIVDGFEYLMARDILMNFNNFKYL
uniref:Uncharacterized protein n=1 Tax=Heterorhabditis bacteriophora TaxID=37862 RepID=A0A1I7WDW2_HETBA